MLKLKALSIWITARDGSRFPGWTQMGLIGRLRSTPTVTVVVKCRFDPERACQSFRSTAIMCGYDSQMTLRPNSNLITRLDLRESFKKKLMWTCCDWPNTSDRSRYLGWSAPRKRAEQNDARELPIARKLDGWSHGGNRVIIAVIGQKWLNSEVSEAVEFVDLEYRDPAGPCSPN